MSEDVPLVVEYSIGESGFIRYYLAPKIDDDWRDYEELLEIELFIYFVFHFCHLGVIYWNNLLEV